MTSPSGALRLLGRSLASREYGDRVRTGLGRGGLAGGLLAGLGVNPNPPEDSVPWFDLATGGLRAVGQVARAVSAGDPGLPIAENQRERLLAMQEAELGLSAEEIAVKQRDAARRDAMIEELEASGLDPMDPEARGRIAAIMLRYGDVDNLTKLLDAFSKGSAAKAPPHLTFKKGDQEVTRIYGPDGSVIEEYEAPRSLKGAGGPDLGDISKIDAMRRQEIGPLFQARLGNQRVIGMLDNAIQTGNPVEAIAGIRTFIASVDQSVVREEETRQFFGSLGVFQSLVAQIEAAKGRPPAELVRNTRAAAVSALRELDRLIAKRNARYEALADSAGVPRGFFSESGTDVPAPPGREQGDTADIVQLPNGTRVERRAIGMNADGSVMYDYIAIDPGEEPF